MSDELEILGLNLHAWTNGVTRASMRRSRKRCRRDRHAFKAINRRNADLRRCVFENWYDQIHASVQYWCVVYEWEVQFEIPEPTKCLLHLFLISFPMGSLDIYVYVSSKFLVTVAVLQHEATMSFRSSRVCPCRIRRGIFNPNKTRNVALPCISTTTSHRRLRVSTTRTVRLDPRKV